MYSKPLKTLLLSSITLVLVQLSGAVFADPSCENLTETRQQTQILTTFTLNPYLRANDLQVAVTDGQATLTGTVEEDAGSELANAIALGVEGIDSIDNQIMVAPSYVAPAVDPGERSFGEVVDDATITATVKSKLLWSKNTEGQGMVVDTRKGAVTLRGAAGSDAAKALAARMAANTDGVVSVDNRLVVDSTRRLRGLAAIDSGYDGSQGVSDGWITAKVTSTFLYSASVESRNIAVSTDRGIVTLSGKVDTGEARALAIELAENIRGVKSVNATGLTI